MRNAIKEGKLSRVLFEDYENGFAYGHTDNFMEVRVRSEHSLHSELHSVRFLSTDGEIIDAELAD